VVSSVVVVSASVFEVSSISSTSSGEDDFSCSSVDSVDVVVMNFVGIVANVEFLVFTLTFEHLVQPQHFITICLLEIFLDAGRLESGICIKFLQCKFVRFGYLNHVLSCFVPCFWFFF
jgi:hypothetical protein